MKAFTDLAPEPRRNLLVLFATGLLFWCSLASLLPTLPLYVQEIGGTSQQIGIVMGAFAIGLLLSRAWLGNLADNRSRKIVLLIGMAVVAIAPLGYLFIHSIPLLIAVRAFHGVSIAAFGTAYSALTVDFSPEKNRGELVGYMSLVNPIGVAIGPAIGGLLQAVVGYIPLFLLSALLGFIGLLSAVQVREPNRHLADGTSISTAPSNQFWRLLLSPRIRIPALVMLLIGLAFGTLSTFVPLYIAEAKVDLNAGFFYTAAAIASFGIRLVTGRASDRYGRGLFISMSLAFYSLSMLLLWTAHSAQVFLVAGFIEGAGAGTLIPMMVALMADRSHPQERARILALCVSGFDVGIAIAGPIFGSVAEQVGYRSLFGFCAILAFIGLVVFATQSSKNLSYSLKFASGRGRDLYAVNQNAVNPTPQKV
ncbi:MAG TPA: MFS transporter [Candidatus Obscuribacterales bacterium]